jgi:hypothetical protein
VKYRGIIGLGLFAILLLGGVMLLTRRTGLSEQKRQALFSNTLLLLAPDAHKRDDVAAPALRQMGAEVCPQLIEWLEARPRWSFRMRMAIAAKSPAWLAKTIEPPLDTNEAVQWHLRNLRLASARALGVLGPVAAPAVPALARALREPGMFLRGEASKSLGLIGSNAVPELVRASGEKDVDVRRAAVRALAITLTNSAAAIPALIASLADQDKFVSNEAGHALRAVGQPVIPFLIEAIAREHGDLQREAAWTLVSVSSSPQLTVPLLVKMLDDPDPETRRQAIQMLTWSGLPQAGFADAVARRLKDTNELVRIAASNGLAKVDSAIQPPQSGNPK